LSRACLDKRSFFVGKTTKRKQSENEIERSSLFFGSVPGEVRDLTRQCERLTSLGIPNTRTRTHTRALIPLENGG
jgi:hypothetical protein